MIFKTRFEHAFGRFPLKPGLRAPSDRSHAVFGIGNFSAMAPNYLKELELYRSRDEIRGRFCLALRPRMLRACAQTP